MERVKLSVFIEGTLLCVSFCQAVRVFFCFKTMKGDESLHESCMCVTKSTYMGSPKTTLAYASAYGGFKYYTSLLGVGSHKQDHKRLQGGGRSHQKITQDHYQKGGGCKVY